MSVAQNTILLSDNEIYNLDTMAEFLEDEPYNLLSAQNGNDFWELLKQAPEKIATILLDSMISGKKALDIVKSMRADPTLSSIPIIFHTEQASKSSILESMEAGVNFYLTKPYTKEKFCAVLRASIERFTRFQRLNEQLRRGVRGMQLMQEAKFYCQTIEQANDLGTVIAKACPQPEKVLLGLSELLINAVEHGNLEITYNEKSQLLESKQWTKEIEKRLNSEKFANRTVTVVLNRLPDRIQILIEDEGKGFEWEPYLDYNPARAFDLHGRGIATACQLSFDRVEYLGNGNKVQAEILLNNVGS